MTQKSLSNQFDKINKGLNLSGQQLINIKNLFQVLESSMNDTEIQKINALSWFILSLTKENNENNRPTI